MHKKYKVPKNIQRSPNDNIVSCQGKIKMLRKKKTGGLGGLGGLGMVYRSMFSLAITALFQNGSR